MARRVCADRTGTNSFGSNDGHPDLRHEVDQNIVTLASASAYSPDDRAVLAEFSAQALDRDPLKKMIVE